MPPEDHIIEAAHNAAMAARDALKMAGDAVLSESHRDVKAQADLDAERAMLAVLEPTGLPILSEEGGGHGFSLDQDGWIIDPLDGTMNYLRGIPMACTCVAYWHQSRPAFGVIQEVGRDVCWIGGVDHPTTVNGSPCHLRDASTPADAVLATGFPRTFEFGSDAESAYARRMAAYRKIRMIGSAGLSLAWTAGGLFDLYLEESIFLWDVAAGMALIEGAGGTAECASPDDAWRTSVVAGAPSLVSHELELTPLCR